MKAVITGGAGFIGSHIADALLAAGVVVHVVDDFSTGRLENLECALQRGTHLHTADVTDEAAMSELLAAVRPELVCHLAAQIDVRRSMAEPAWDARRQRHGHRVDARGGGPVRRAAVPARLDGRGLRGPGGDTNLGVAAGGARLGVRRGQSRGRVLPRLLCPPLRALDPRPPHGQRLRPAPGPRRRSRRDHDLPAVRRGRPSRHRLRRRAPDARLRPRGRRGRGVPRGGPLTGDGGAQHRHRPRDARPRDRPGARRHGPVRSRPSRRDRAIVPRSARRQAGARLARRDARSATGSRASPAPSPPSQAQPGSTLSRPARARRPAR